MQSCCASRAVGPVENLSPPEFTLLPSIVIHNTLSQAGRHQLYFQLHLKEYFLEHGPLPSWRTPAPRTGARSEDCICIMKTECGESLLLLSLALPQSLDRGALRLYCYTVQYFKQKQFVIFKVTSLSCSSKAAGFFTALSETAYTYSGGFSHHKPLRVWQRLEGQDQITTAFGNTTLLFIYLAFHIKKHICVLWLEIRWALFKNLLLAFPGFGNQSILISWQRFTALVQCYLSPLMPQQAHTQNKNKTKQNPCIISSFQCYNLKRLKNLTQQLLQEIEYNLIGGNWKLSLQRRGEIHYVRGGSEKINQKYLP